MRRALAPLLFALACAGAGESRSPAPALTPARGAPYHAAGKPAARSPVWVSSLSGGSVEYQLLAATRTDGGVVVERAVVNRGDGPVRLDLGRVRLRTPAGDEVPLVQACLSGECLEASAARGQVTSLEPGDTVRLRADFGPLPSGEALARATFVDEGIFVGGKLALVAVELERN